MNSVTAALVMTFTIFFALSIAHEQTHKVVAESYGCNADIQYTPDLTSGSFMSTNYICMNISEEESRDLKMTQNQVELVGYTGILASSVVVLLLSIIAFEFRELNSQRKTGRPLRIESSGESAE